MSIGIICAMKSELEVLKTELNLVEVLIASPWSVYTSEDNKVVAVIGGVGKVSAAASLSYLLSSFDIEKIIGVGVAGGIAEDLRVGDVIICSEAMQYDMDVTAFGYEPGMIPGLRLAIFEANSKLVDAAMTAANFAQIDVTIRKGRVLSGDKFIASVEGSKLRQTFSGDCVDMETAAWAHVAHLYKVPWVGIRSISDQADGEAPQNFTEFLEHAVCNMSMIITHLLRLV
ncbi:MAG: 5'-methylthioadenosine/adenosylhomocysteine nucleosidase [Peptococcaceae bacterium]|nr:5'-methylthioadenosine/adenosylhomocysteine nucleosidase [Peptococcaceae bacterium]